MKIKNVRLGIIVAASSIALIAFIFAATNKKQQTKESNNTGFAVVELFTSEGCSSCPAADAAIAKLLKKNTGNTYILSYHVDYWNRLGWKDNFSQHAFSERQQLYAKTLSLESIYTPQVIVNGTVQFVGSNVGVLYSSVKKGLQDQARSNLHISVVKKDNRLAISYDITGPQVMLLNTAIILPEATTEVKRGENGGRTLQHVNIVRDLTVTEVTAPGTVTMEIPKDLVNRSFKVIAYTQSKPTLKVLGADEVEL